MISAFEKAPPVESRARKVTGLKASAYGNGIAIFLRERRTRRQLRYRNAFFARPSPGNNSHQHAIPAAP